MANPMPFVRRPEVLSSPLDSASTAIGGLPTTGVTDTPHVLVVMHVLDPG